MQTYGFSKETLSWYYLHQLDERQINQSLKNYLHSCYQGSEHKSASSIHLPRPTAHSSGVPRGVGVWGVQTPPPQKNSEGPPKNHAKLNLIVKTLKKIAEFRTPTHLDVPKKGSKILKLRRFATVLH